MAKWNIVATCAFGLEAVTAREVKNLGYEPQSENGIVRFSGDDSAIARANLWLRTAERVFVELDSFPATTFEELFQGVKNIPWEDILWRDAEFPVTGKSVKSTLHSVPACQSITKKAIVERLKEKYQQSTFDETGPTYKVEVSLLKDVATIRIDTSGAGLHRRGYRKYNATAPLRETLAAALVLLSRWDSHRPFIDPLCGSGTIAIEAAMYGLRRAPGMLRGFASESWPGMQTGPFGDARDEALDLEREDLEIPIIASDIDDEVLELSRRHVQLAKLQPYIQIRQADARALRKTDDYGCIISNPPYGERLMTVAESEELYRDLGRAFRKLDTWSVFMLTSDPHFERLYGKKADKRRKLYNGRIETQLYQYLGPLPPRGPKATTSPRVE